ncbi:LOW QUALITY PROTEIN: Cys-tRNA(Pro) deacylase YbaK [Vibrio sp. JCM 18904]|nr:LOW QUALITY PROTEIN: Cys-tRNA(Pro) deacylase YbaK [Vibrio sp. JCM 18904]
MTPAINLAKKKKIPHTIHQYEHDPRADSYGLEAAEVLGGQDPKTVFKTLLFCLNGGEPKNLAVAIIPVDQKLNLKLAAKAAKQKGRYADPEIAQKTTGYVVGGISHAEESLTYFFARKRSRARHNLCSAGKRGLEIELAPERFAELNSRSVCTSLFVNS